MARLIIEGTPEEIADTVMMTVISVARGIEVDDGESRRNALADRLIKAAVNLYADEMEGLG